MNELETYSTLNTPYDEDSLFFDRKKISNIFENESLKNLLDDLIDEDKIKPFECVGTREELKVALLMSIQKTSNLPILLSYAKEKLGGYNPDLQILNDWNEENFLSQEFSGNLKNSIHE